MPITAISGLPGNGKTALMMEMLDQAAKKGERPIFAGGIDGLQPGLATVLDDPKDWNAKNEDGSYRVPDGALIFIDEAWKWFGHLHDAGRQATPPHVLALAEHRHRGIDFVWTFQTPAQIYPFARGLIAEHLHVLRRFGTKFIDVFKWSELNEDVKSAAKREMALRTTRTLPEAVFGKYKSAEVHTIKRQLPFRVLALPALVVAAGVLIYFAYTSLKPDNMAARISGEPKAAQADSAPALAHASRPSSGPQYATVEDYVAAHKPRIGTAPWTARIFDGRAPTAEPEVYCISSGAGEAVDGHREASFTCITEQGTRYVLTEVEAKRIARDGGVYNPYRRKVRETVSRVADSAKATPKVEKPDSAVIAGDASTVVKASGT